MGGNEWNVHDGSSERQWGTVLAFMRLVGVYIGNIGARCTKTVPTISVWRLWCGAMRGGGTMVSDLNPIRSDHI